MRLNLIIEIAVDAPIDNMGKVQRQGWFFWPGEEQWSTKFAQRPFGGVQARRARALHLCRRPLEFLYTNILNSNQEQL